MPSLRIKQLNAVIESELAPVLRQELGRSDVLATITEVSTSPDLAEATVWISLLPNSAEIWEEVEATRPELQSHLATRLETKRVPRLRLRLDTGAEHQAKIDQLLHDS